MMGELVHRQAAAARNDVLDRVFISYHLYVFSVWNSVFAELGIFKMNNDGLSDQKK